MAVIQMTLPSAASVIDPNQLIMLHTNKRSGFRE
jgi:hypothetical protein